MARLQERDAEIVRVDPRDAVSSAGRYALSVDMTAARCEASYEDQVVTWAPSGFRSALVRRPNPPRVPDMPDPDAAAFFTGETRALLNSISATSDPGVRWVNHPHRNWQARDKLLQLRVAASHGLAIPSTLLTNDPRRAFAFYESCRRDVICKPLSSTPVSADGSHFLYTHKLADDLTEADFAGVAYGSGILQQHVTKQSDVRVAVVGDRLFACEILSQENALSRIDWRAVPIGLEHRLIEPPEDVRTALLEMRSTLGLSTMHADFAIDLRGRWWFLETNPNGQWLWIELLTSAPISSAYADLLIGA